MRVFGAIGVGLLLTLTPTLAAPSVDELVAGFEQARGGAKAWREIDSVRMSGVMRMGQVTAPMTLDFKRSNRVRLQFQVLDTVVTQAYDGEQGWSVAPFVAEGRAVVMDARETAEMRDMADFEGALAGYKANLHQVTLDGEEDVDGVPSWRLKVLKANGDGELWWLAKDSLLAIRTANRRTREGVEVSVASTLADYRPVNGLLFPFNVVNKIQRGAEMLEQVVVLERVELGVAMEDSHFALPDSD